MQLTQKDTFLLDIDETLHDFPKAERENLIATFKRFHIEPTEALLSRFHEVNDMLWKALERGEMTRQILKTRRFSLTFEEFGIQADAEAIADAYYFGLAEVCCPYEGAKEFLEELSRRGRIYIVTNGGSEVQRRHLKDAGFLPYLSGVFISDEVGCNKPSQAYADYVAAHIPDFDRSKTVWLGDSLTSDGACAKRLGVDFVHYGADDGVKSYEEFLSLLQK